MFLHIGLGYFVDTKEIIMILNNKSIVNFQEVLGQKSHIKIKHKKGKMYSTVICDDRIYITPLRPQTLFYRWKNYKEVMNKLK